MIETWFEWAEDNVIKIALLWFLLLAILYVSFYPLYYVVAAGVALAGIPVYIKDKKMRFQAIGFFIAFAASFYVFVVHLGRIKWWSMFGL